MKFLSAFVCFTLIAYAFADGEIKDITSLNVEGHIVAYFDVVPKDEAVVIHSRHGVLTVVPGQDDKMSGSGESIEGPWFIQLMHPTTTETLFKPVIEGADVVMGSFYVNDNVKVSYQDVEGVIHAIESGAAKVKVTKSGDGLKVEYHGDLEFAVLPAEAVNPEEGPEARALHKKKGGYGGYSQPAYYPVYQPVHYYQSPIYQSCCPAPYLRMTSCQSSC